MRYLTVNEVLEVYGRVMQQSGGLVGIRDLGALESAVAQPRMTFGGEEFYPTLVEKASALGFSLIQNHPFVDGNKRAGHAAMETFLVLNGYEISASRTSKSRLSFKSRRVQWGETPLQSGYVITSWRGSQSMRTPPEVRSARQSPAPPPSQNGA